MSDNCNNASTSIFQTSCRQLEQFLWLHGIKHLSWHKNADGMTEWVYPDTKEVRFIVSEYRQAVARRNSWN